MSARACRTAPRGSLAPAHDERDRLPACGAAGSRRRRSRSPRRRPSGSRARSCRSRRFRASAAGPGRAPVGPASARNRITPPPGPGRKGRRGRHSARARSGAVATEPMHVHSSRAERIAGLVEPGADEHQFLAPVAQVGLQCRRAAAPLLALRPARLRHRRPPVREAGGPADRAGERHLRGPRRPGREPEMPLGPDQPRPGPVEETLELLRVWNGRAPGRRSCRCRIPRSPAGGVRLEQFLVPERMVWARSSLDRPVSRMSPVATRTKAVSTIRASPLSPRTTCRTRASCSNAHRVDLVETTTSANSICSTRRSTRVRSSSSPARSPRSRRNSPSRSRAGGWPIHHRHHRVEAGGRRESEYPSRRRNEKVAATGSGSAMPVPSISR